MQPGSNLNPNSNIVSCHYVNPGTPCIPNCESDSGVGEQKSAPVLKLPRRGIFEPGHDLSLQWNSMLTPASK